MTVTSSKLEKRPKLQWLRRGRVSHAAPFWLIVPGLAFALAAHFFAPIFGSWYAFTNWNGFSRARYVGLANFREILHDPTTRNALLHTVELAVCFVVTVNVIGLLLALGVNRTLKTRHIIRAVIFAPIVIGPLAVSYVWGFIFDYNGAINQFLTWAGLGGWRHAWLGDPGWALWSILLVLVWQYSGLTMIIFLAGLQSVPDELIEASAVDGASIVYRFRRIVFPLLAPAFTVSLTLTLIFGLRVFDQVVALTAGGPVGATETIATQVYTQTFTLGRFGYGAALSVTLTVFIACAALVQLAVLRRREVRL